MSSACCTARASPWTTSASAKRRSRIRAKSGASSPATTTSSAARPPASGSTIPSRNFSASSSASLRRPPTITSTSSRKSCAPPSSCPAHFFSVQYRSALHNRFPHRLARRSQGNPRLRMEGQNSARLPPRPCRRSGLPRFCRPHRQIGQQTGEDTSTWTGYLNALRKARARFREMGCTSTDHGHPTAQTADLPAPEAATLFAKVLSGNSTAPKTNSSAPRCSLKWRR